MPDNSSAGQSIALAQAVGMTTLYRQNRDSILAPQYQGQDILAICETFSMDMLQQYFADPKCASLRIYYGMSADLKVHAILVGADENGQDIISSAPKSGNGDDPPDDGILEDAQRCPDMCPPDSPLNASY